MPRIKHVKRQWIYIILFLVLFIMMLGLNSRLSEYFRLSSQQNEMNERIVQLESTQDSLETQIAYANSDKAVEEWARTYEKQVLPGDQLIVPLPLENEIPEVNYVAVPTTSTSENWQIWWDLFFE
ncbi:MAG: septum formation initiator family protein [Pelolinea sp.]|nr:septum formation initiator family protein [Pelolinea sp.]